MSVRDKLVELAYVRWEMRERATPATRPNVGFAQPGMAGARKLALVSADEH